MIELVVGIIAVVSLVISYGIGQLVSSDRSQEASYYVAIGLFLTIIVSPVLYFCYLVGKYIMHGG